MNYHHRNRLVGGRIEKAYCRRETHHRYACIQDKFNVVYFFLYAYEYAAGIRFKEYNKLNAFFSYVRVFHALISLSSYCLFLCFCRQS